VLDWFHHDPPVGFPYESAGGFSCPYYLERGDTGLTVTVYTTDGCVQCDLSKKLLQREGITYREFRVDEDDQALNFVKGMGYLAAPVIVVGFEDGHPLSGDHWAGFNPEKIKALRGRMEAKS